MSNEIGYQFEQERNSVSVYRIYGSLKIKVLNFIHTITVLPDEAHYPRVWTVCVKEHDLRRGELAEIQRQANEAWEKAKAALDGAKACFCAGSNSLQQAETAHNKQHELCRMLNLLREYDGVITAETLRTK